MWDKTDQPARWFMRAVGIVATVALLAFGVSELVTDDWAKGITWLVGGIALGVMTALDWPSA